MMKRFTANKSGEMDAVENNVEIVYSPCGNCIIRVLSSDWYNNTNIGLY